MDLVQSTTFKQNDVRFILWFIDIHCAQVSVESYRPNHHQEVTAGIKIYEDSSEYQLGEGVR